MSTDRPRLVASDLDGTLLNAHGKVSARTHAAWTGLWSRGIETVLVTARPPRWVEHLAPLTGDHGVVLCGNGAFVYDVAARQMRESHGIAPDLVAQLCADLRAIPGVSFLAELADGSYQEPGYRPTTPAGVEDEGPAARLGSMDDLPSAAGKLIAHSTALPEEEFRAEVECILNGRATVHTSCAGGLAEISALEVTKAGVLSEWARGLGIAAADVWAFGDMPNDLPMIQWAGVGWAVANADASVLAAADRYTAANTDDGVARALEPLLES